MPFPTFDIRALMIGVAFGVGCSTPARPPAPDPYVAPPGADEVDWPAYAHDAGGTRFSPANQIRRDNVGDLVPVWTYRTG